MENPDLTGIDYLWKVSNSIDDGFDSTVYVNIWKAAIRGTRLLSQLLETAELTSVIITDVDSSRWGQKLSHVTIPIKHGRTMTVSNVVVQAANLWLSHALDERFLLDIQGEEKVYPWWNFPLQNIWEPWNWWYCSTSHECNTVFWQSPFLSHNYAGTPTCTQK